MGAFIGGSAYAMASQIGEGYILVSPPMLKKFTLADLKLLAQELDKSLREIRSESPPLNDVPALQLRNHKISRLSQALLVLRNHALKIYKTNL